MQEYIYLFNALDGFQKVYWTCAVVGTLIFAVQLALTLIGMDSTDVDVDFDGADTMDLGGGMSLFSIKNFVNFLVGFGWAGVCLGDVLPGRLLLGAASVVVGFAFVYMFFIIKKQTKRLEHNGAFNVADCVGKMVDVYLRIPARRSGKGKVQVSINGSVQELEALSDSEEDIRSGCKVRVLEALDNSTVLVGN